MDDDSAGGRLYAAGVSRLISRGDVALAVALAVLGAAWLLVIGDDGPTGNDRAPDVWGYLLVVAGGLVLVVRRVFPVAVAIASSCAIFGAGMLGYASGALPSVVPLLALGSATYHTNRRTSLALVFGGSVLFAAAYAAFPPPDGDGPIAVQIIPNLVMLLLAGLAGDVLRQQQAYARKLEAHSQELARHRATEKRDAIVQERSRIAREMHDIVGHALAAIALQARAGRRRLAHGSTDRADVALAEIDTVAGQALADTRRAVGLLRTDDGEASPAGRPGLMELDELVAALRTADVRIELHRERTPPTLPPPVQAAAYRIVQESLSNVVKHAHPAHATVVVRQNDGALIVDVRDDGTEHDRAYRPGHGLRGMRERVEALGGTLDAGPVPTGGWRVLARLPQALE